ncbi:MAG: efflux RND transporter periplasmic adaptor subunit [Coriobacteriia bacterium]|nr:efflux RND transporter periplasmic adaptor subunit [Coriobacteriia bacterium]MBN2840274.1 efflux RND transporter periplasmic adaptor subunit [Coriobacteriia bacterium]
MKKPLKKTWQSAAIALVALAIVAGSAYYGYAASVGDEGPAMQTAVVVPADIRSTVPAEGRISVEARDLFFSVPGVVAEVAVKPGDTVAAGQVLATLSGAKADVQVAQAEAALAAAQAKLDSVQAGPASTDVAVKQASVDGAAASLASAQEAYNLLYAESLETTVPASELQAKKAAVTNAASALDIAEANLAAARAGATSADIAAARAGVAQAQASVDAALLGNGDLQLVAPSAGTVIEVNIQPGASVTGSGGPAIVVADLGSLFVEAELDENDYASVSVGMPVEVLVDALDGASLEGTVTVLSQVGKVDANGIVSYALTAELDPAGTRAAAGMSVRLDIITEGVADVLVVPNEAVRMTDGKQFVDVLDEAGSVRAVEVALGMTDGSVVEVIDGLESGQRVVLPGAGE